MAKQHHTMFLLILFLVSASLFASQDPYTGWMQLRTDHFQIIYEERDVQYACHVASFADDVYDDIVQFLDHAPKKVIPVVIAGRTSWANGYYSPFPPSITIYTTSDANRFLGSKSGDWLRSVFTHELAHYIHLTAPVGPAKFLTPLFGPDVPAMNCVFMPLWWIEGISTYAESTYAEGGRKDSPVFALSYLAPLWEDAMWSIRQGSYASAFPPAERVYATGLLMVDHIARIYGEDSIAAINRRFAAFPFFGISFALHAQTGRCASQLFSDALAEQRAKISSSFPTGQLFSPPSIGDFYLPSVTSQGVFGFAYTLDEGSSLIRYPMHGGDSEYLASLPASDPYSITVTADGKTAVFSFIWTDPTHRSSLLLASAGYADLYRYDISKDTYTAITHKKKLFHPSISADGSRLVAIEASGPHYHLVEVDQSTGETSLLYAHSQGSVYEPQLSPDGSHLVAIEVVDGFCTLIAVDQLGNAKPLWPHASEEILHPRFVDEHTVLFAGDRSGSLALYSIDIQTKVVQHLLDDPVGIVGGVVSGDSLIYGTYRSNGYALYRIPLVQLTPALDGMAQPAGQISLPQEQITQLETADPYYDYPRLNLWLPLPMEDGSSFAPGAWLLMQSVLGRHFISAQAAWSIEDTIPMAAVQYQYHTGLFTVTLDGMLNACEPGFDDRRQNISITGYVPLSYMSSIQGFSGISTSARLAMDWGASGSWTIASGQCAYAFSKRDAPKDYFGSVRFSLTAGTHALFSLDSDGLIMQPYGSMAVQLPLFSTHQVLAFELDGMATSYGTLNGVLLPEGNAPWEPPVVGEAKGRATVRYHIPLGLFDQPVAYGGLTGMGISFFAQSAAYLVSGAFAWEEDIYAGAKVSGDITIGSLAAIRPYIGITVSTSTLKMHYFAGIDAQALISSHADIALDPAL